MPESSPKSGDLPRSAQFFWPIACGVGLLALALFAYDLASEPHFVDESAYFSQAYFADLLLEGRRNDVAWIEKPAYDLPPLPKYLMGWTLRAAGYSYPRQNGWRIWYENTSRRFDRAGALAFARIPSVVLGASAGCVAVVGLGTLVWKPTRGACLAALFLMINPLFTAHARATRCPTYPPEAFVLLCLAVALWTWRRTLSGKGGPTSWLAAGLAGAARRGSPSSPSSRVRHHGLGDRWLGADRMGASAIPGVAKTRAPWLGSLSPRL